MIDDVRVEASQKRIRVFLGGEVVADSRHVKLVWESRPYPVYYFPPDDIRMDLLSPATRTPGQETIERFDVRSAARVAERAAFRNPRLAQEVRDHVAFRWSAMDGWFEEDEEVFVHARDPHTRIDVLASSRHVRVEVDGTTVAESRRPHLLFETGLPVRYYLPKTDVRMDLLRPTATSTGCPYKGTAEYWSVEIDGRLMEDVAWSYRAPLPESAKIAGLISFFDERVDVFVDGVLQERPVTVFAR